MDGQWRGEWEARHDHVAGSREGEDLEAILLEPLDLLFRWFCVSLTQDSAYGKAALLWRHLIEGDRQMASGEESPGHMTHQHGPPALSWREIQRLLGHS